MQSSRSVCVRKFLGDFEIPEGPLTGRMERMIHSNTSGASDLIPWHGGAVPLAQGITKIKTPTETPVATSATPKEP